MSAPIRQRTLWDAVQARWALRRQFVSFSGWLIMAYDRLVRRYTGWPWPGRGRVMRLGLTGLPDPVFVRLGSTDLSVVEEIFVDREYDGLVDCDLGKVKLVVDLGANIGLSMRLWLLRFPGATVIGVEPDEGNFHVCKRNLEASSARKRTRLVRACVAARSREVALERSGGEWGIRMLDSGSSAGGTVMALTLEEILRDCGVEGEIDLLKCDIEGSERELFADCGSWIGRVRNMVVEIHAPYDRETFFEDLRRCGSQVPWETRTLKQIFGVEVLMLRRAQERSGM